MRRRAGRPSRERSEQFQAAEALLAHDTGGLSAATASGKTVAGAYLIGQRRVNTLLLVHSSAFLEQWKDALERFLNIEEPLPEQPKKWGRKKRLERIRRIGAGKHFWSGITDIAIMQSLFEGEEKDVKPLVAECGPVRCLVDAKSRADQSARLFCPLNISASRAAALPPHTEGPRDCLFPGALPYSKEVSLASVMNGTSHALRSSRRRRSRRCSVRPGGGSATGSGRPGPLPGPGPRGR